MQRSRRKSVRKPIPVITLPEAAQILSVGIRDVNVQTIHHLGRLGKLKLWRLRDVGARTCRVVEEPQVRELRRHPRVIARAARMAAA